MSLDDEFAEEIDYDAEPAPLEGLDAINRRLATLRVRQQRLAEYDATSAAMVAELTDRIDRGRVPLVEAVGYLERSLQLAHQALFAADPTRTRIQMPNGVLASKAGGVEWVWPKDDSPEYHDLVAWAKANHRDVVAQPDPPPPRIVKNALKAAVQATTLAKGRNGQEPLREDGSVVDADGAVVPGVVVVAKPREFTPQPVGMDE